MWTENKSWDDSYANLVQPSRVFDLNNEGLSQDIDYLVTRYDEFVFPDIDVVMDYLLKEYESDELSTPDDIRHAFNHEFVCGASSEYYNCDFVWREVPLAKIINDYQLDDLKIDRNDRSGNND